MQTLSLDSVRLTAVLVLLLLLRASCNDASEAYYCLEGYKPIGTLLKNVAVAKRSTSQAPLTSGNVARQCAAACDAAPQCSGFRAVGPRVKQGSSCELLTNSTAAFSADIALQDDHPWPRVNDNLTSVDHIQLRSISWMCWRNQQDWDQFGAATHALVMTGSVQGNDTVDHTDFCAFGVDVAGTNLMQQTTDISAPKQCDAVCRDNATGCSFWIFVASQPDLTPPQAPFNCFLKADPFRGQNGWTGKPKSDLWIADSQVTCFSSLQDWRQLGLVASPAIKTIQYNGSFFTVFPERVTWAEANSSCAALPGGKLAILDSKSLIDTITHALLDSLPFQTAVRSAWVGASGNNPEYDPRAPKPQDLAAAAAVGKANSTMLNVTAVFPGSQGPLQPAVLPKDFTLTWSNGQRVPNSLLRRLSVLDSQWNGHDDVWKQQRVPLSAKDICGRVLVQLPPTSGPVDTSDVLPGVWYFDCDKPAAFICQSATAPSEPTAGGRAVGAGSRAAGPAGDVDSGNSVDSRGGSGGAQPWQVALAVVLPVLAVALLGYQLAHVYSRKMARLPDLIRQQRKRALGQPRTGKMSTVITDIQGYTALMQQQPDQMMQALLIHNTVIRHAVYDNVGWIVEQEGDSFSVVFHEAEDAVAFTLQVQQALLQQSWPDGIGYNDDWEGTSSHLLNGGLHNPPQGPHSRSNPGSIAELPPTAAADGCRGPSLGGDQADAYIAAGQPSMHSEDLSGPWRLEAVTGSALLPVTSYVSSFGPDSSRKSTLSHRPRNLWLFNQLLRPAAEQQKLFSGLRVRMGVATGEVAKGQELKSSGLYRRAQDVSNAALGGEVLLDESTFAAVKEAMWRLGAVGPAGMDYDELLASKSALHSASSRAGSGIGGSCLPALAALSSDVRRADSTTIGNQAPGIPGGNLAVALDMGCYEKLSPSDPAYPSSATATGSSAKSANSSSRRGVPGVQLWTKELGDKLVYQYQQYMQQQLQHQREADEDADLAQASDGSFDEEVPCAARSLGSHHAQQNVRTPTLTSTLSRSSRPSFSFKGSGSLKSSASQTRQQHRRLVSRAASVSIPLQQLTLSLFGVSSSPSQQTPSALQPDSTADGLDCVRHRPALGYCSISAVRRPSIRLYQVVSPTLLGRAALFGPKLDLPPSWRLLDLAYFAAPGLSSTSITEAAAAAAAADVHEAAVGGPHSLQSSPELLLQASTLPQTQQQQQWHWARHQQQRVPGRSRSESQPFQEQQQLLTQQQEQQQQQLLSAAQLRPDAPAKAASNNTAADPGAAAATKAARIAAAGLAGDTLLGQDGKPGGAFLHNLTSVSPFLAAAALHRHTGHASSAESAPNSAPNSPTTAAAMEGSLAQSGEQQQQQLLLPSRLPGPPAAAAAQRSWHSCMDAPGAASTWPSSSPLGLGAASSSAQLSAQHLLALRAASLQPGVTASARLSSIAAAEVRRVQLGLRTRQMGLRKPSFPSVTILFATVEGSGELLHYPALARSVHQLVHHLMLQLLRSFPGSYLVRAQQGDLKYMLAFTSPEAAVGWGLTLQEAALYLPYPQEVLGLNSCGVQLDEGGRLVFRGPRIKMGVSEGTPKVIMPDHLGRADYHGSFVNLAARYAAVAAQGGQLATDEALAGRVLRLWKASSTTVSLGTRDESSSNHSNTTTTTNRTSEPALLPHSEAASAAGAASASAAPMTRPQSHSWSEGSPPRSKAHLACTAQGPLLLRSPAGNAGLSTQSSALQAPAGAGAGAGFVPHAAAVAVECCWLGSFLFKGNPTPVSMVTFNPACLSGRHCAAAVPSSKGVRVLQRVGVMERAVVQLPAAVEGFGPWEDVAQLD